MDSTWAGSTGRPCRPRPGSRPSLLLPLLVFAAVFFSGSVSANLVRISRRATEIVAHHHNLGLKRRVDTNSVAQGAILASPGHQSPEKAPPVPLQAPSFSSPLQRRDALKCGPTAPCPDESCCGTNNKCGYGPDFCGSGNCISNCNATAMCGKYSAGGNIKCGMNLCCSAYGWCGTDDLHCNPNPTEANGKAPCQQGFGLCQTVPPPSCGVGSGTTNGRTIGYYQASNTRDRLCNRISPSQINLDGLTHLYFAFAKFDPSTFAIVPGDAADEQLYPPFNALQSKGVKTWVAVGGFDFSDPGTATHTAWSDMVSTASNRGAFIQSLKGFMSKWGFQGVDLDWEYPVDAKRGGRSADTANFVELVKEMKAAFGGQYGISLTLAPDYWYLRGFDAKAMEPYVDFFGFMAYDLHGYWDTDVKTLGSVVRGQADIRDISNDTMPLWFDALNPSKINFGLAYYGRGYTLSDPSCNTLECRFKGPSKPGICTNYPGVMSLVEIEHLIQQKGLKPTLLPQALMKQITWDDQWIGYDDAETVKMKKAWADGQCFGGTMIWSVDFNSGSGSGDLPTNTTDGTCGPKFGNTVCGDWSAGSCCSPSGYCGNTAAHCGNGCSSGPCTIGGETTDGTCGASFSSSFCGSFAGGSCCSLAGYCGSDDAHCAKGNCQSGCPTADGTCGRQSTHNTCKGSAYGNCCSKDGFCGSTDAHCGAGCQNGDCVPGAGNMTTDGRCSALTGINCLNWPQGECCSSGGWCGNEEGHCGAGCQSGPCEFPTVVTGFCEGPDCKGGICVGPLCVSVGCSGPGCNHGKCLIPSLCIPLGCIGPGCTDGVCVGSKCGSKGCHGDDCDSGSKRCKGDKCISTGCEGSDCDGGSGKCRGPHCNRHSCTGEDCVDGVCVGPHCSNQSNDYGGGCEGNGCPGGGGDGENCQEKKTASTCITTTTSTIFKPATTWTTWSFSECRTNIGCSVTDSSSSTTATGTFAFPTYLPVFTDYEVLVPGGVMMNPSRYSHIGGNGPITAAPTRTSSSSSSSSTSQTSAFISCSHHNMDPGDGITVPYCVCSGSTFAESVATYVTPYNSCGYTDKPTSTIDIGSPPKTTDIDKCQVCSVVGHNNQECTSIDNCTPKPTDPPKPTGSLCLSLWGDAFIGGSDQSYGVFKPGAACTNKQSVLIGGFKVNNVCDLGKHDAFLVCGKKARFVNEGPVFKGIEKGHDCALQLQIDGVNYSGSMVDPVDKPCSDFCKAGPAFGTALGRLKFDNVPICD